MKQGFRQSMTWLHTWSSLLLGWLLFTIFLAGTASYFRPEISTYLRPEIPPRPLDQARAANAAQRYLTAHAGGAERWFIRPPTPRDPGTLSVFWRDADGPHEHLVDIASGERSAARETRGGDFFYRLHFDLHYLPARAARWIVGAAAMMMLVGIVTGVVTHKRIFKDFFTFRREKGQRSWLDAHNALAVLSLPYHLVITYTGLITLMFLYMPWGVQHQYGEDTAPFFDAVFAARPIPEATGIPASLATLGDMVRNARSRWDGDSVGNMTVWQPGDAAAEVNVRRGVDRNVALDTDSLQFDREGTVIADLATGGAAAGTREVLYGLHLGRFAAPGLRVLLFLAGIAGTAMVATGLVLWNVKRTRRRMTPGVRVVSILNLGVVGGLPLAMAVFFWANRLLPAGMPDRAEWEIHSFFLAWAGALVMALPRQTARVWRRFLAAAAVAYAGIPVLTALTTQRGLVTSAMTGDWAFAGFDLAMLALAATLALGAHLVRPAAPMRSPAPLGLEAPGKA